MKTKIQKLINKEIAPALAQHGGSLKLVSIDADKDHIIVNVHFQGACIGCPHAISGTLKGIESFLQEELSTTSLSVNLAST